MSLTTLIFNPRHGGHGGGCCGGHADHEQEGHGGGCCGGHEQEGHGSHGSHGGGCCGGHGGHDHAEQEEEGGDGTA